MVRNTSGLSVWGWLLHLEVVLDTFPDSSEEGQNVHGICGLAHLAAQRLVWGPSLAGNGKESAGSQEQGRSSSLCRDRWRRMKMEESGHCRVRHAGMDGVFQKGKSVWWTVVFIVWNFIITGACTSYSSSGRHMIPGIRGRYYSFYFILCFLRSSGPLTERTALTCFYEISGLFKARAPESQVEKILQEGKKLPDINRSNHRKCSVWKKERTTESFSCFTQFFIT